MMPRKPNKPSAEEAVRDIRRATRRHFSAEEKIRIVLEGLAVTYTDRHSYFVSESSVYRLLKAQDLITSPAYILMQASDKFQQPSTWVNELWQTDFTYFKIIGWGWHYLSMVLDDYSRFIVALRLCTSMSALDVLNTLDDVREFAGTDQVKVKHQPRLLSDNGPCYIAGGTIKRATLAMHRKMHYDNQARHTPR